MEKRIKRFEEAKAMNSVAAMKALKNYPVVLMGRAASGKDTLKKVLLQDPTFSDVISYTTRPPREGEIHGVDYVFLSEEEFLEMYESGIIAEAQYYRTVYEDKPVLWFYGSPRLEERETHPVLVLEPRGAKRLQDLYGGRVHIFFLDANSEVRKERYTKRVGELPWGEWLARETADNITFACEKLDEIKYVNLGTDTTENYYSKICSFIN